MDTTCDPAAVIAAFAPVARLTGQSRLAWGAPKIDLGSLTAEALEQWAAYLGVPLHSTVYDRDDGRDPYAIDSIDAEHGGLSIYAIGPRRPLTDREREMLAGAEYHEHRDAYRSATVTP